MSMLFVSFSLKMKMTYIEELMKKMFEVLHAGIHHSFYISEECCVIKYSCTKCDCDKHNSQLYTMRSYLSTSLKYAPYPLSLYPFPPFPLSPSLRSLGPRHLQLGPPSWISRSQWRGGGKGSHWGGVAGGESMAGHFSLGAHGGPLTPDYLTTDATG